jgi:hypothetical protein
MTSRTEPRANYLIYVTSIEESIKHTRTYLVVNALSRKHALNHVLSTGHTYVPSDRHVMSIRISKDRFISRIIELGDDVE